jgi:hypothetical protein
MLIHVKAPVFAAIDWLIHPDGSPGDAGVGGFFDAGDGDCGE